MVMEPIIEVLPEGWREKARELNAFRRAGDYLKTPEDLLRLLLLWADLGTFGHTAAFLRTAGDFPMSKVAIFSGFRKARNGWRNRVTVADATKALGKELYTLHMMIELFSLSVAEQILTDGATGESMTNFQSIRKNDLMLADRVYGTVTAMRWLEERGAYYAFRLKAKAFNLYRLNEKGRMPALT